MDGATGAAGPSCVERNRQIELGCLAPALVIILVLASFERRVKFKPGYCNGRPGILVPINFPGGTSNRYTFAATFGATASMWLSIAFNKSKYDSPWLNSLAKLTDVLLYGVLFYPFFACLTTKHKLVGSLLGLLYSAMWWSFDVFRLDCKVKHGRLFLRGPDVQPQTIKMVEPIVLAEAPTLLCLTFIVLRFGVVLFLEVRKRWLRSSGVTHDHQENKTRLAGKSEIIAVRNLLGQRSTENVNELNRYRKLLYFIYKPREDFKFSTQMISTIVVAAIFVFQIAVYIGRDLELALPVLKSITTNERILKFGKVLIDGCKGGIYLLTLWSYFVMFHFIKCHRDNVLDLCRGNKRLFQNVVVLPSTSVGKSLRFSGYVIAYTLWGLIFPYILWMIFMLALAVVIEVKDIRRYLGSKAEGLIPPIVIGVLLWLFQVLLLNNIVFRDKKYPDITVTIDNRRIHSIASYFFFFFNILIGLGSFLSRLFKALLLGLFFMSRIDRSVLMPGFQKWDKGFFAYLGFLRVLVAHRHPVLLVFCQLLIDRNSERHLKEKSSKESQASAKYIHQRDERNPGTSKSATLPREPRHPRLSKKAANRWLVAKTLLCNPEVIRYRQYNRPETPVKIEIGESNLGLA